MGEMSESNWFINLTGMILFRYSGTDGRVIFTMGLEKFGCELVSCIEMAHTVVHHHRHHHHHVHEGLGVFTFP